MSRMDGQAGENKASDILANLGYKILDRNYHSRSGEIDIVAEKNKKICFIEVKYRQNQGFGLPQEAVTKKKLDRIFKTAKLYLYDNDLSERDWQIDVFAINKNKGSYKIIENVLVEGLK